MLTKRSPRATFIKATATPIPPKGKDDRTHARAMNAWLLLFSLGLKHPKMSLPSLPSRRRGARSISGVVLPCYFILQTPLSNFQCTEDTAADVIADCIDDAPQIPRRTCKRSFNCVIKRMVDRASDHIADCIADRTADPRRTCALDTLLLHSSCVVVQI